MAPLPQGPQQSIGDGLRVVPQQQGDESWSSGPGAAPPLADLERGGNRLKGALQDRDQVHRISPGVRLLHPLRGCEAVGQARKHGLGQIPPGNVQRLERLVGEVQHVTGLEVAVIGCGGKEHVGELSMVGSRSHGRDDAAFGSFRIPDLDELAKPALDSEEVRSGLRERAQPEAGRFTLAVGGNRG